MSRFSFAAAVCLALAMTSIPAVAAHDRPIIAVGEVSARSAGGSARLERLLREIVTREVERLRLSGLERNDAYVLSVSLVRLDGRKSQEGSRATSVVSATLRRESSGAILAVIGGRGAAEGGKDDLDDTMTEALGAAVRGAVRRLPEAF